MDWQHCIEGTRMPLFTQACLSLTLPHLLRADVEATKALRLILITRITALWLYASTNH